MSRSIITGIDIGTYHVKVVVVDASKQSEISKGEPKILGIGISESKGLRNGYILNTYDIIASIKKAVSEAEKKAGVKINKVFISIGGIGLGSINCSSSVIITRADLEITLLDIKKLQEQCEKDIPANQSLNKKIIHTIPIQYKIDGKVVLGKPEGMKGSKLEIKSMYITCLEHHLNDLIQSVEEIGLSVQDVMASPIASSLVTLTKSQKVAGCVLANIGAETVSIAVFENNIPVSLEVFPIGSTDITNDIALGLKVSLEEAEQIKIGAITGSSYSRKKLEEIIIARTSDIFELIENHLKKIGRNGLLPAGIVLTGGGAQLSGIEELAKNSLKLPARIGSMTSIKDLSLSVAYGLCIFGIHADEDKPIDNRGVILGRLWRKIVAWFKMFLP
ncbi:MAG: cell division protein FtsA [Patescibacteria group bacterium]